MTQITIPAHSLSKIYRASSLMMYNAEFDISLTSKLLQYTISSAIISEVRVLSDLQPVIRR